MTEPERAILSKILFELFLESPRRKTPVLQQDKIEDTTKMLSATTRARKRKQPGGKENEQ